MKSILLGDVGSLRRVFPAEVRAALGREAGLSPDEVTRAALEQRPDAFSDVTCIFSTWGMPALTEEEIARYFPALQTVFYAAGSVQGFARPFLNRGVRIFSAWGANAVPVAEYAVSQILLANKGFFQAALYHSVGKVEKSRRHAALFPGNYGCAVGLIGAGMIGRMVAEMLLKHDLEVYVCDPYFPPEEAEKLGLRLCELPELFAQCQTVSNHLPNNAQTVGMLNYALFSRMREGATFLNTGRGAQVVEADLCRILTERPDLTALLDVTQPEPPAPDSPLYRLRNAILTPHIAGSSGREVERLSRYMLEEFRAWHERKALRYEVTQAMLATMA